MQSDGSDQAGALSAVPKIDQGKRKSGCAKILIGLAGLVSIDLCIVMLNDGWEFGHVNGFVANNHKCDCLFARF